jgi:hypothetical protein
MEEIANTVRSRRIAMLIDGDNAQPSLIGNMLAAFTGIGRRRI